MTTETVLQILNREYAETVFGNCDDGSLPPDQAIWNDETIDLSLLRSQYDDVEAWLKTELLNFEKDFGYASHWQGFLDAEDFQAYHDASTDGPPVISIDNDGTIQIWDGWHRIACALVRGIDTMSICVGRPLEPAASLRL